VSQKKRRDDFIADVKAKRSEPMRADHVDRIHEEHAKVESALRASVQHAINCGELLIEAKKSSSHGKWADWLRDNIKFSERLAQAYMRLARLPVEKRNAVADLPLREALSAIRSREHPQVGDSDTCPDCNGTRYCVEICPDCGGAVRESACVALYQRGVAYERELAQWLLDHPQYSSEVVADWLECGAARANALRKWAADGFQRTP